VFVKFFCDSIWTSILLRCLVLNFQSLAIITEHCKMLLYYELIWRIWSNAYEKNRTLCIHVLTRKYSLMTERSCWQRYRLCATHNNKPWKKSNISCKYLLPYIKIYIFRLTFFVKRIISQHLLFIIVRRL